MTVNQSQLFCYPLSPIYFLSSVVSSLLIPLSATKQRQLWFERGQFPSRSGPIRFHSDLCTHVNRTLGECLLWIGTIDLSTAHSGFHFLLILLILFNVHIHDSSSTSSSSSLSSSASRDLNPISIQRSFLMISLAIISSFRMTLVRTHL